MSKKISFCLMSSNITNAEETVNPENYWTKPSETADKKTTNNEGNQTAYLNQFFKIERMSDVVNRALQDVWWKICFFYLRAKFVPKDLILSPKIHPKHKNLTQKIAQKVTRYSHCDIWWHHLVRHSLNLTHNLKDPKSVSIASFWSDFTMLVLVWIPIFS